MTVWLVELSNYECSFVAGVYPTKEEAEREASRLRPLISKAHDLWEEEDNLPEELDVLTFFRWVEVVEREIGKSYLLNWWETDSADD